ncbi:MAG: alanine racemase, partial [Cytophagales bacterium]|nr:alanine racemase [Cytophagales bacterium]
MLDHCLFFTWSTKEAADLQILETRKHHGDMMLKTLYQGRELQFDFYFDDDASVENIVHCICIMLHLGLAPEEINKKIKQLRKVAMRLELKEGVNNCYLIDDSYNNDLAGLKIAVDFLVQQNQSNKKTIIFSDVLESGMNREVLYKYIAGFLKSRGVTHIIGIGFEVSRYREFFEGNTRFFPDTKSFLQKINPSYFQKEVILIKGARIFQFEKIVNKLLQKVHGTLLEINLDALVHNFNFYKSRIKPETKIMAMVKSFAYGSGTHEIASVLQFHKADYLAVAYTDEGVRLREAGITLPIMVMNPSPQTFDKILQFHLEPVAYSLKVLEALSVFTSDSMKKLPIHLEIDSGMRRLGFEPKDLPEMISKLKKSNSLYPVSVFTHLAGSDEERLKDFTRLQMETYKHMADELELKLGHTFIRHAVNSAGILRYPEYQMDMVRLGIGLYGIEASRIEQHHLQQVSTLKTTISQIKTIKAGESVGYGRNQF